MKALTIRTIELVIHSILIGKPSTLGQAGMHSLIDSMILIPLHEMNAAVPINSPSFIRNNNDFLFCVKNCCIFRGKEEETDFEKAKMNLSVENSIKLPYVFGYSATATLLEFFVFSSV